MASSTEILLVPNQRLAQHHQAQHAKAQRADGLRSWDSAAIFALETWLLDMWQLQQANGVVPCCESWVLSGAQELQLWRQVLQQEASWMLAPESAAEEMMAAYRYCRQWDLDIAEEDALRLQFKLQEDSAFFLQCVDTFTRNCRERMAVASADLAVVLSQTPRPFADKITLLDFEELTPAVKKLCAAWGIDYAPQTIDVSLPSEASVLVCDEAQQELEEAAKWAAEILLKEKDFPNINIAVVVPGLESRREEVEQAFIQVFDAEYQLPLTPRHVLPFNITAGQRMTDLPMVQVALLLLQLNKGVIDVDRVPALLYSPFLCLGESLDALTVLEKRLRDFQDFRIQRSTLLTVCGSKGLDQEMLCPTLLQSLQQAMQLMAPFRSQRRSLVDWLALFADQLQLFGWPGERALDSVEYQQLQRWYELMAELPAVQLQAEALSWQAALNLMQFQLSHAVFQAQSQPSPLQIMGPLEAAGLPFSHLRLVGVDDRQLPALAAPSPFIPLQLQRDLDMPHASPERELRVAKRLLADLATNAKQISFSYARQSGQGEVQVSPLLRNLHSDSAIPDSQAAAMVQSEESGQSDLFGASLPLRNDRLAPVLSEDEDIRGGVRVLENQALCPFKSFAEHRLQAPAMTTAQRGISPMLRGSVAHKVMESVWLQLRDQQGLLACDDLKTLLANTMQEARAMLQRKMQARSSARLIELEIERLYSLVEKWLQHERGREAFTVRYCEYELQLSLFGKPLSLRIDRVDELADGSALLIDYKTGGVSINGLVSEPTLAPQLPIYALHYTESAVSGVAFARLDNREPAWAGVGSAATTGIAISKRSRAKVPDFAELREQWREDVQQLEEAFVSGVADAAPAQGPQTCRYCHLQSLCRINEQNVVGATEGEEA